MGNVMYKIEKGVEYKKTNSLGLPFEKMEIGDSFLFPKTKRSSIHACAITFCRSKGNEKKKFKTATTSETECRIWRIK